MKRDLTRGSVIGAIVRFSVPYFISYFLQTFYGLADLFITGQFNGAGAITAVAGGSQIMHFVTVVVVGLSVGTTVLTGHAVGSRDDRRISRITGNTVSVFLISALVMTGALLFAAPGIVDVMQTPPEARQGMLTYIMICFAGIPMITAYNVIAAIFRGLGDSRTPMYFVFTACVLNVGLDYLLIGVLGMGPSGAAIATVVSQTVSVILYIILILTRETGIHVTKSDLVPDKEIISGLIRTGLPIACQDGFIQVSFLVITAIANSRGVEIAAAVGIVEKMITFLFLVPSSMLSTISSAGAQCIGAEMYARARKVLMTGMAISVSIGAVFAVTFQFMSAKAVGTFTSDPEVIRYGTQYLMAYVTDCVFASVHFCFSGYFSCCGLSIWSFIHNACSIVLVRIPGAYLASRLFPDTLYPMGLAAPAGSLLSALICVLVYFMIQKKTRFGGPDNALNR